MESIEQMEGIKEVEEWTKASDVLREVAEYVAVKKVQGDTHHPPLKIGIYGQSGVKPDDPLYQLAYALGVELGKKQYHIISGGYSGTMEAVSHGASLTPGAIVEGVISPAMFPMNGEKGNAFCNVLTRANTIPERIGHFLSQADAYIVLPGSLGTLTELCLTWNVSTINVFGGRPPLKIFAWRTPWQQFVDSTKSIIPLPSHLLDCLVYVDSVEHVVTLLQDVHRQAAPAAVAGDGSGVGSSGAKVTAKPIVGAGIVG